MARRFKPREYSAVDEARIEGSKMYKWFAAFILFIILLDYIS